MYRRKNKLAFCFYWIYCLKRRKLILKIHSRLEIMKKENSYIIQYVCFEFIGFEFWSMKWSNAFQSTYQKRWRVFFSSFFYIFVLSPLYLHYLLNAKIKAWFFLWSCTFNILTGKDACELRSVLIINVIFVRLFVWACDTHTCCRAFGSGAVSTC